MGVGEGKKGEEKTQRERPLTAVIILVADEMIMLSQGITWGLPAIIIWVTSFFFNLQLKILNIN